MNTKLRTVLISAFCIGLSFPALSLQAQEEQESADETVERITVYGRKTLPEIKKQIQKASLDFFKDYNKLNVDHQYDMICRKEKNRGSNFQSTNCAPRFVKTRRSDILATQLNGGTGLGGLTMFGGGAVSKSQKKKFNDHLVKLLQANPELFKKFQKIAELQSEFAETKAEDKAAR